MADGTFFLELKKTGGRRQQIGDGSGTVSLDRAKGERGKKEGISGGRRGLYHL